MEVKYLKYYYFCFYAEPKNWITQNANLVIVLHYNNLNWHKMVETSTC